MQTRYDVKLMAPKLNDPQLYRPLQQVSILDDLVEEEASMICDAAAAASNTRQSQDRPRRQLQRSLDSTIL